MEDVTDKKHPLPRENGLFMGCLCRENDFFGVCICIFGYRAHTELCIY